MSSAVPTVIRAAVAVVVLEAAGIAVFAVVELVNLDPDRPSVAITSGVFFLIYAAGLVVAARGIMRLQTWSRSIIVMAQVIQLALAWSFRGGDTSAVAWALAIPAVVTLLLVFSPPATQALFGDPDEDGESTDRELG